MWINRGLDWFFLPNPIFLNFQKQNPLKNQYLPHLSSENCEISSIKSDLLRAFQQHQEHAQIPIQMLVLILCNFHWENHSTINSFHTVAPNSLQTKSLVHPYSSRAFWRYQEHGHEAIWSGLGDPIAPKQNKTKQTTLLHKQICEWTKHLGSCHKIQHK
jgi:hypothetical protein